jgi:nitrate reductase NapAB chaperone NapD
MLLRINIFANGDHMRERGEVILLDVAQMINWPLFLHHCANKLNLSYSDCGWKAYTSEGGLIRSHTELIQNDVLFLVRGNETFLFREAEQIQIVPDVINQEKIVLPSPPVVSPSPSLPVLYNPLILNVKIVWTNKEFISDGYSFRLKHRDSTVKDLKRRIGKKFNNLHVLDQVLINQGKEMEDSKHLRDYFTESNKNAVNGDIIDWDKCSSVTIFLVVKQMTIYVKNMQGKTIVIEGSSQEEHTITHETMVSKLKEILRRKTEFNRLLFNQQVLADGEKLSHYGVHSGCVMYMC